MQFEVLLLFVAGVIVPLCALVLGWRAAVWTYIALAPLYMYQKAVFETVLVGATVVQWPTLAKDLAGTVLLAAVALAIGLAPPEKYPAPLVRMTRVIAAFTVYWLIASVVTGAGLPQTVMGLRPYLFYTFLGFVFGAVLLSDLQAWRTLAVVLLAGAIALAAVALIHAYLNPEFLIHRSMRQMWAGQAIEWFSYRTRLRSIFTSANTLGFFMATGIITGVWLMIRQPRSILTLVLSLIMIPFTWVLGLTLSRSALLACGIGLLLLVRIARPKLTKLLVPLLGVTVLVLIGVTSFGARFATAADNPRLLYWGGVIAVTLQSRTATLIGHGVGSIGRFGAQVQHAGVNIPGLSERIGGQGDVFAVDNFFIRSFYETGILGFGFLVWTVWLAWQAYRFASQLHPEDPVREVLALPIALMTFVITISAFTDSLGTYPWNMLFWLCAIGSASVTAATQNRGIPQRPSPSVPLPA